MAGYYYLGAQLPLLFFEREPQVALDDFLAEARKWLSESDVKVLETASLETVEAPPEAPEVLRRVVEFEWALRSDLEAYRRAVRAGQDYKPTRFPPSTVKEGNPLEVEKKILKLRWDFLSELEVGHCFDIEFVLVYYLKLRLLDRLLLFDKDKGVRAFQQLCEVTA